LILQCFYFLYALFNLIQISYGSNSYSVVANRINSNLPVINSQIPIFLPGSSIFDYNYNAAFVPNQNALLVRCQNQTSGSNQYLVGPSRIAYVPIETPLNDTQYIASYPILESSVVIAPNGPNSSYGCEDPRIAYSERTGLYYILYSSVANTSDGNPVSRLALAVTPIPGKASTYVDYGAIFPDVKWSKSGSLLVRDYNTSYLFWGDSSLVPGLQMATTQDLIHYDYNPDIWLPVRTDNFDSVLVEAGPMPMRLSDGNYLFLYNSARSGYPSNKPNWNLQYNVGWVILDGNDPSKILQRAEQPLLSPELDWETGTSPYLGLTPNVVFCEGWTRGTEEDSFIIFYGGADSVIGAAEVTVLSS